jgi:ATP-dependent helicase Lhr and Lhr-like helicase
MAEQTSSAFGLLDERIRRWIWSAGWAELRDAQERAIHAILPANQDVIIAAATAAGKTEAAFLPVLSNLLQSDETDALVLYISPLKALINDQFARLEQLCETLEVPVWPWHGDIPASQKTRFQKKPAGVLLITPESLEALLCTRGFSIGRLLGKLRFMVVDELHAFIGSERGKQLQSLMHRVQLASGRIVPRIGLSATLGDMTMAAEFLRPRFGQDVYIIESKSDGGSLKILVKGFIEPAVERTDTEAAVLSPAAGAVAQHLYSVMRGSNNLIFPNARAEVEQYTYLLSKLCEADGRPIEFWPHHGNLSKDIREETERALKNKETHATAICTSTLELGIDIGSVKSVGQVGPPPSVAALRQRLGRSGRRKGESSILRGYVIEPQLTPRLHLVDALREDLFQMTAMISLLLEGWFEPPRTGGLHVSTLVQQLLSLIAQHGGVTAADAYRTLCAEGAFGSISKADFMDLLRSLGAKDLIMQESSGLLLHGQRGEKMVNHYSFYAAFNSDEEYRVETGNKTLGTIPITMSLAIGDFILFAARTWRVEAIDEQAKVILVSRHKTGRAPTFTSRRGQVHQRVRSRMRELYESTDKTPFLDAAATEMLEEGRETYRKLNLKNRSMVYGDSTILLFPWLGDAANEALVAMLRLHGLGCMAYGMALEITGSQASEDRVFDCFADIIAADTTSAERLFEDVNNLAQEKWDWALSEPLLVRSYVSLHVDIPAACAWVREFLDRER